MNHLRFLFLRGSHSEIIICLFILSLSQSWHEIHPFLLPWWYSSKMISQYLLRISLFLKWVKYWTAEKSICRWPMIFLYMHDKTNIYFKSQSFSNISILLYQCSLLTFTFSMELTTSLSSCEYCPEIARNCPILIFASRLRWLSAVKGGDKQQSS